MSITQNAAAARPSPISVEATMPRRLLRSVVGVVLVAGVYATAALVPVGAKAAPDVGLTIAGGLVLAIAIVLVADRLTASRARQFAVWFALVFLNLASVAVEGTLFAPAAAPPSLLTVNLIRLGLGAALIAALVAGLFGTKGGAATLATPSRSVLGWLWRLLAVAGVYIVLYLVLGGINYSLVTRPYYEAHAGSLTVPPAATIFLYEPIRGMLIGLSVLPLILAMQRRRGLVAIVAGAMLFIGGGLVPLLPQASLPLQLRIASLWEIFGHNFLTGVASAYLFTQRRHAPNAYVSLEA